jgi:hypothetical protein
VLQRQALAFRQPANDVQPAGDSSEGLRKATDILVLFGRSDLQKHGLFCIERLWAWAETIRDGIINDVHHLRDAACVMQHFFAGEFRNNGDGGYPFGGEPVPQQKLADIRGAFGEMRAYAVMNGEDGFSLGQDQREVVHVARNMVDVTLMERSLNKVEQAPRYATALKPANPSFCGDLRRQRPSNGVECPL